MSERHDEDDAMDGATRRALDAWTPMAPPADFVDRVLAARAQSAPVARARRWWLAAPVAVAAMFAVVLFLAGNRTKRADRSETAAQGAPSAQMVSATTDVNGAGSASVAAAGSVAQNQPATDASVVEAPVDTEASLVAIAAGRSATVHDRAPATSVQIDVDRICPVGASVTALRERDGARGGQTATASGLTRAVIELDRGTWTYEVWCTHDPDVLAAEGTIRVVTDDGPVLRVGRIRSTASGVTITGTVQRTWGVKVNGVEVTAKKDGSFEAFVSFGVLVLEATHPTREHHFVVLPPITK